MKLRTTLVALSLFAAGVLTAAAVQQEATFQPPRVTKHHNLLLKSVGAWTATMTSPMANGPSKGSEVNEMLGELWLTTHFKGQFLGSPFEGRGLMGYDTTKKKYVGVWIDTTTDTMSIGEGTYEADRNAIVMKYPGKDQVTQKDIVERHVLKFIDADTRQFRILVPGPDAKHSQEILKIVYKKK